MANNLATASQPTDVIVSDIPWQHGLIASYLRNPRPRLVLLPASRAYRSQAERLAYLETATAGAARVWYQAYQALGGTEAQGAHAYLATRGYLAYDATFGTTRLLLFHMGTAFLQAPTRILQSSMGPAVQLIGFGLPNDDAGQPKLLYKRHEVVPLVLFWRTSAVLDVSYTAFVHVQDANGRTVLFADDEPDKGKSLTISWSPGEPRGPHSIGLPSSLPQARTEYTWHVRRTTGRRLPVEPHHPEGPTEFTSVIAKSGWRRQHDCRPSGVVE
jgi:hypothetical protein